MLHTAHAAHSLCTLTWYSPATAARFACPQVICHGIPDSRPLQDGDIVSFDVSCYLNGVHGDNCGTVAVGNVDEAGIRLIKAAEEGLMAGINAVKPEGCLTSVGAAIQEVRIV